MAMTAAGMKAKVAAAYFARTGKTMAEGDFNVLIDLCQGIIDEITANAKVASGIAVSTTGTAAAQTGATTAQGTIS